MKTHSTAFESTYALIVRSEEKQRNTFEGFVYAILVLSTVFSVCLFGQQPFVVPSAAQKHVAVDAARPA